MRPLQARSDEVDADAQAPTTTVSWPMTGSGTKKTSGMNAPGITSRPPPLHFPTPAALRPPRLMTLRLRASDHLRLPLRISERLIASSRHLARLSTSSMAARREPDLSRGRLSSPRRGERGERLARHRGVATAAKQDTVLTKRAACSPRCAQSIGVSSLPVVTYLDGRWGRKLEANLERYDRRFPGRFATFCHVDSSESTTPGFDERLAASLRTSAAAGAGPHK